MLECCGRSSKCVQEIQKAGCGYLVRKNRRNEYDAEISDKEEGDGLVIDAWDTILMLSLLSWGRKLLSEAAGHDSLQDTEFLDGSSCKS